MKTNDWKYQHSDNDCWICALINALKFKQIDVNKEQVLKHISFMGLDTFNDAGFFTYIPLLLSEYGIYCKCFTPSWDKMMNSVYKDKKINIELVKIEKNKYLKNGNALYYFFLALEKSIDRNISFKMGPVDIMPYLEKGNIILPCISVDKIYKIEGNFSRHVVTLIPNNNDKGYICVDPLEKTIEKKYIDEFEMFNWASVDEYLVIL